MRPLLDDPLVMALRRLPGVNEASLVGGVLRDRLLERPARDVDAVVAGDGETAARGLAELLKVRVVRLGGDRFAAYRLEGADFRLDLWDRAPMSLEDDLRRRDFTVNSMALRLADFQLVDPFGGRADLERHELRATSERSFVDDPLRVLRLARFAVELPGFRIDPRTATQAQAAAAGLATISAERMRDELRAIFGGRGAAAGLELLGRLGVYPDLWMGGPASDAPRESTRRQLELLESRIAEIEAALRPRSVERFVATQTTIFAGLSSGAERLREFHGRRLISNREVRAIEVLLTWPELPSSEPARRWFLHRTGELWPTATAYLGSLASDEQWRGASRALVELARSEAAAIFTPTPLLDGHEIAEIAGIPPGPRLGELAGDLRRAQIEGRVSTREAAIAWLERQTRFVD